MRFGLNFLLMPTSCSRSSRPCAASSRRQVSSAFEEWMPDVRVTFSCDESLDVLGAAIATIPDGHVMYETIARTEDYTGERSYNMQ